MVQSRHMDDSYEEQSRSRRNSHNREKFLRSERTSKIRKRATRQSLSEVKKASTKKRLKTPKLKANKKETNNERKAPTLLASNKLVKVKKRKRSLIICFVMLLGLVSSAMVSFFDEGQIDVQKTIKERNERIRNNTANENDVLTSTVEIPVQNTNVNTKPDGGLVGRGIGANNPPSAPEPEPTVASSTATSSLDIASSSEVQASSTDNSEEENDIEENAEEETLTVLE